MPGLMEEIKFAGATYFILLVMPAILTVILALDLPYRVTRQLPFMLEKSEKVTVSGRSFLGLIPTHTTHSRECTCLFLAPTALATMKFAT